MTKPSTHAERLRRRRRPWPLEKEIIEPGERKVVTVVIPLQEPVPEALICPGRMHQQGLRIMAIRDVGSGDQFSLAHLSPSETDSGMHTVIVGAEPLRHPAQALAIAFYNEGPEPILITGGLILTAEDFDHPFDENDPLVKISIAINSDKIRPSGIIQTAWCAVDTLIDAAAGTTMALELLQAFVEIATRRQAEQALKLEIDRAGGPPGA